MKLRRCLNPGSPRPWEHKSRNLESIVLIAGYSLRSTVLKRHTTPFAPIYGTSLNAYCFFRIEGGLSSGRRWLRGAPNLTDEFRIRYVNIMCREELHLRLTRDARFLHGFCEAIFLKFLKRLLRFPNIKHVECIPRETRDVKDAARRRLFVEIQSPHYLVVLVLGKARPFHQHHSRHIGLLV